MNMCLSSMALFLSAGIFHEWIGPIIDPNLAYILLILGAAGLFGEVAHPGSIFPGVFGTISLLLGLYIANMLSATWTGLLLMLFAFLLFVMELFITSHGILGLGGIIALLFGSFMLFDTDATGVKVANELVWVMVIAFSAFVLGMVWLAIRAQRSVHKTGTDALIGAKGVVKKRITPDGGIVFVHGELWQAVSKQELEEGMRVRVRSVDGMTLEVEKLS